MPSIRPMCLGLLCACTVSFAVMAQTVNAGAGAYTLAPKAADRVVPAAPYRTPAMLKRAAPSNQWYSALVYSDKPEVLFAHPLTILPSSAGIEFALPSKTVVPTERRDVEIHYPHQDGLLLSPTGGKLFAKLLRTADIIALHVPLTARTRQMLNAKRLARCKPGVVLINTARGALVGIDAILEGLQSGHIGGVGLDVLEDEKVFRVDASRIIGAQIVQKTHAMSTPGGDLERRQERLRELQGIMRNRQLLAHENVFFTPHVGFNSVEAIERINLGTVRNIREFAAGRLRPEAVVH